MGHSGFVQISAACILRNHEVQPRLALPPACWLVRIHSCSFLCLPSATCQTSTLVNLYLIPTPTPSFQLCLNHACLPILNSQCQSCFPTLSLVPLVRSCLHSLLATLSLSFTTSFACSDHIHLGFKCTQPMSFHPLIDIFDHGCQQQPGLP